MSDRTKEWAAIGLLGVGAPNVLRALGAYGADGDPRLAPPFAKRTLGDIEAHVLLESDHRALVLVPAAVAGDAWRTIERTGRPFGISCVGLEAARRYLLHERALRPATLPS